ncbi:MAG: ABC transporter permease subunit, partial [Victivallaceae bacterium]|nr:ABC transporter permease subunit [Victivallaceae bacterium]
PQFGMALADWDAFAQGWKAPDGKLYQLPAEMINIYGIDFLFQDYLKNKYKTIAEANTALQAGFKSWADIFPPQRDFNYLNFQKRTGALRWEYVRRNYISVIEYIVLHGRGIFNTLVYCSLAVLMALIVNPLAAYALSRYRPPSAYKVLLFLMLTMAFPPMVTQIPVFLMLREFNLLNSFFALILPGIANGYSIFLLKGFFDSLPQELYESAELDGAGEFRIFWQITMSLSKPILAVIGLNAFTLAYSNFMMALLICQDQKMWTLMPWLYQLQQNGSQGVIFASLVIAAIPTFLIFVFCQNIIMRGIVVPVEK